MSGSIFISYRRSDTAGHANNLHDRLAQWFDADELFYDTQHINPGDLFPARLADAVAGAKVVLVLIGPDWTHELNRRAEPSEAEQGGTGQRETDFVRVEVEQALQRMAGADAVKVIPVLLGMAAPSVLELNAALRTGLAKLFELDMHAFQGKNADWNNQFVRLRDLIAAVAGVPAPRYRAPAGISQPHHVLEQSLSPHFIDPNGTLAALQCALEAPGPILAVARVALYGMGGSGKTQMALRYCDQFRDRHAGIWWLRAETDTALQVDALACCKRVGAVIDDGEKPAHALKRWLGQLAPGACWLLVFDNADDLQAVRPYLPERGGHHVIITSRNPAWSGIAQAIGIDVWTPAQGAGFLAHRLPGYAASGDAGALQDSFTSLSTALGGLPLALEQAAGFLDATAMDVAAYTAQVLDYDSAPLVLDEGRAATGYERSVLATLSIAFPRLGNDAAQLLRLLAFCAPDPVPERLFVDQPDLLPAELALSARQPLLWEKAVGALRRYGLAVRIFISAWNASGEQRGAQQALQLHRLTQEVVRHTMAQDQDADALLALLRHALPEDAASPKNWPWHAILAPHVMQLDRLSGHLAIDRSRLGWTLDSTGTYFRFGPAFYPAARYCYERTLQLSRDDLGDEHPNTLAGMNNLANMLWAMGDHADSLVMQDRVLIVRQRVLGDEHPDTLITMCSLVAILNEIPDYAAALAMGEPLLVVCKRVLGEDHSTTLITMTNLAQSLKKMGGLVSARAMEELVLAARRRLLGEEHPNTLRTMNNLAHTLGSMGMHAEARDMQKQVLAVQQRMLGEAHPDILTSMNNLACTLWKCGEPVQAIELMARCVELSTRKLGIGHPDTVASIDDLAWMRAAHEP